MHLTSIFQTLTIRIGSKIAIDWYHNEFFLRYPFSNKFQVKGNLYLNKKYEKLLYVCRFTH